jgi:hypothetical protein
LLNRTVDHFAAGAAGAAGAEADALGAAAELVSEMSALAAGAAVVAGTAASERLTASRTALAAAAELFFMLPNQAKRMHRPRKIPPVHLVMVVSALPSNEYGFNNALTDLSSTSWTGSWSSRGNNTGSSLIFDSNGTPNVSQSITIEGCTYTANQQTWIWSAHPSGKNIFNVQLGLVSGGLTSCFWAGKPLSGPAIVSQQNGQTQLDMMLLDGTGAGISYRGTR